MIVRKIIDGTVYFLGLALSRRTVRIKSVDCIKVNMGCGLAIAPGWINVDASLNALFAGSWVPLIKILYKLSGANRYYSELEYCRVLSGNRFVFHDLAISLPFEPNSVDVFYSSHFLEHLFKNDALRLIEDCYASLKKGGLLRIAVPDLGYAIEQYGIGKRTEMLENYFFVDDRSSYLARHKYMYDFEMLSDILSRTGFSKVVLCGFRVGVAPDIDILDNRPEETLFIEAIK